MPRSDFDKSKFDCKKGDYCVGKANDLADPTLQNRAQEYRRQISGKTRDHRQKKQHAGENKEGHSDLHLCQMSAMAEHHPGSDGEDQETEAGYEHNVERTDTVNGKNCQQNKTSNDRENPGTQAIRQKRLTPEWESR